LGSKDQFSRFRTLFSCHLPNNILIINKDLTKKFFVTDHFLNTFGAETFEQIKTVLSNLRINLNTFEQDSIRNTGVFSSFNPNVSLIDFMIHCKNDIMRYNQIICFKVEGEDFQQNKTTYDAKMLHIKWDDEDNDAFVIILNDLTLQETILALKVADVDKDRILSTVSHELRTPVNGILGITQVIEQEYKDSQLVSYCQTVKTCSKILLNLVNSILDLTQIRNNCFKLNLTSFKLVDIFEEIKSVFQAQCENKGIIFEIDIAPQVPRKILSDYYRLMQVLFNLLANALKFTFHGKITVKVERTQNEGEIKFTVEDTGIGIKEDDKPKLFKMFGRVEHAYAKINVQGVGLGLTISNSLVKLLNQGNGESRIDFASEFGKGSIFFFTISTRLIEDLSLSILSDNLDEKQNEMIPRIKKSDCYGDSMAEDIFTDPQNIPSKVMSSINTISPLVHYPKLFSPKAQDKPFKNLTFSCPVSLDEKSLLDFLDQTNPNPGEKLKSSQKKEYVLIVDDNPFNILITSKIVEKYGFNVVSAFNGKDAIEKAKTQKKKSFFRMIFMDCEMPVMDGYEATRILRNMMDKKEIPEIPIFALTANESRRDQEKCEEAGMIAHFTKPVKESEFVKALNKMVYLQK